MPGLTIPAWAWVGWIPSPVSTRQTRLSPQRCIATRVGLVAATLVILIAPSQVGAALRQPVLTRAAVDRHGGPTLSSHKRRPASPRGPLPPIYLPAVYLLGEQKASTTSLWFLMSENTALCNGWG